MCAQKVPQVVEQERSPTRDPPQSVSSSRSLRTGDGGGPRNAPVDAEDVPHRPDVCVTDAPGDEREAREQRQRLVVQVHGIDFALGHSSQPDLRVSSSCPNDQSTELTNQTNIYIYYIDYCGLVNCDEIEQVVIFFFLFFFLSLKKKKRIKTINYRFNVYMTYK
jgi:hypothetical protein